MSRSRPATTSSVSSGNLLTQDTDMHTDSWKRVTTRNLAARYEMGPHDGSNRLMPADLVSLMLGILARDIRLEAIGYIDSIEKTYR